jgi:hypothetical protein
MLVSDEGSTRRSATLRCVMKHALLAPLTATAVLPVEVAALMAYSAVQGGGRGVFGRCIEERGLGMGR